MRVCCVVVFASFVAVCVALFRLITCHMILLVERLALLLAGAGPCVVSYIHEWTLSLTFDM